MLSERTFGVKRLAALLAGLVLALVAGPPARGATLPRPAHVVVVIEENHTLRQIVGNPQAPYLNALARRGALFTHATGVMHPSLPNYFALFAGLTNTNGDDCPATGISPTAPNLATSLAAAHLSFTGYAESLPAPGWLGCAAGPYGRKHVPWAQFTNIPQKTESLPFSQLPPFAQLPTVAFVIPNVNDDMHDGTVAEADTWLARRLGPLVDWAQTHDTLLIVTWDEGYDAGNDIPTIFVGPMVRPGRYAEPITHFNVLRTIEDLYGLPHLGRTAAVAPIADCWK